MSGGIKLIALRRSGNPKKKYDAIIEMKESGKQRTVSFGAAGMSDYTKHHDDERKSRYIARHQAREDWNNPMTAGYYARWILWNKKTIRESLADMLRRPEWR